MSTSKQRREAAQRHLQRQLERRAAQAAKRRRNALVVVAVLAVVVVAGGIYFVTGFGKNDSSAAASSKTSSTAASAAATTNADGTISCDYVKDTTGNANLKDVGTPPNPDKTPTQGTDTLKMATNQGDLTLRLNRSSAPCAAASFAYLASKKFFDNTPCHREVNEATFGVLQCGDPTGSGSGGPSYTYRQEVTPKTTYPRGTIAMANTGQPNSTGSQFFLCFTDTKLSPDYSAVGTVDEAGLAVLDKIAAAGNNGSFASSAGGGAPNLATTITSMTVAGSNLLGAFGTKSPLGPYAVTRSTSKTPSTLRTVCSTAPRWVGSASSKVNRLIATRSRLVCTDADRMLTRSSASALVTSESSRCRSSASTWMATRKTAPGWLAHSTSTSRSALRCRSAALVQSVRCTLTPPPRVTKPRISSPGTGVQHLASLVQTSVIPWTTMPGSPLALRRTTVRRVGIAVSAMSSVAPSAPPSAVISFSTTDVAETWFSPTAA